MPRPKPPRLYREPSRHGQPRWYVRKHRRGKRIRIDHVYDSPEFWAAYRAALELPPVPETKSAKPHTLEWSLDRYRDSSAWAALSNATRRQSENIFRHVIKTAGTEMLSAFTTNTIATGRERRKDTPHAANNFLKAVRRFFKWACDPTGGNLLKRNPTVGVKMLRGKNRDGFHTWTEVEITRFEQHWKLGTRERLALALCLYTGLARGDVVKLGRQHIRDGVITFRMEKHRGEGVVYPPVLPPLAEAIAATKCGDLTFLVSERGAPFVKESFGNWFRDKCTEAGCPGSAHGLRKAGATRAAENGATLSELMALFGWMNERVAMTYIRKADRKRLAAAAGHKMLRAQSGNKSPAP